MERASHLPDQVVRDADDLDVDSGISDQLGSHHFLAGLPLRKRTRGDREGITASALMVLVSMLEPIEEN